MNVEFTNPLSDAAVRISNAAKQSDLLFGIRRDKSPALKVPVYAVATRTRERWVGLIERHDRSLGKTIVIDSSTEGHTLSAALVSELAEKSAGLKVIILTQNLMLIHQIKQLKSPDLKALYFHSLLFNLFRASLRMLDHAPQRERYIASRRPGANLERSFTCLMQKSRPARLAIFGWLRGKGYLSSGAVSFHRRLERPEVTAWAKRHFPAFTAEIDACNEEQFPFVNFEDEPAISRTMSFTAPPYQMSPFSLVVETEMSRGNICRYTEKTAKAILACHRFVIAGNPGTLPIVRSTLNAETFDKFLPADYDRIEDPQARLESALKTFESYLGMTVSGRADFLRATWPACEHNFRTFRSAAEREIRTWFRRLEVAVSA